MNTKAFFLTLTTSALVAGMTMVAATTAPAAAQVYYQAPPPIAARAHELRGVVTSFYRFEMSVGSRGENVPVQLHQGTVIEPLGASLQPGTRVTIRGYWNNGVFFANRIIIR